MDLEAWVRAFKALADPTRLRVLDVLARGEHCVCEIQAHFEGLPRNLLSHHLRVLKEAGLVHSEKRGRWVHYRLDEARLEQLRRRIPEPRPEPTPRCGCRVGPEGVRP